MSDTSTPKSGEAGDEMCLDCQHAWEHHDDGGCELGRGLSTWHARGWSHPMTAPDFPTAAPSPGRCNAHGPGGVGPCRCDDPPPRSVYLLLSDLTLLEAWSDELRAMFPDLFGVYLVGSSLVTTAHRDVDVRVVIHDDVRAWLASAVNLPRLHLSLSLWGQKVTGLPIDCQTQSLTESGNESGPIRPLNRRGQQ